jgi:rhomboid family GlyGly-CTERM serine protease
MKRNAWQQPGRLWVALALLGAAWAAASVAWQADAARWSWDRAWLPEEPWRWATGALTHWSAWHAGANVAGALVLATLGWRAGLPRRAACAWALAAPLGQLLLLAHPDLMRVAGLSGWLHAGVAIAALHVMAAPGRDRWVGALIGLGLLVKLGLEQPWGPALRHEPLWGAMPVAPWAHAAGALAGVMAVVTACGWRAVARAARGSNSGPGPGSGSP